MATGTTTRIFLGRHDAGRLVTLDEFSTADFEIAHHRYELARGVVVVTEVPGLPHGRIVRRLTGILIRYDDAHPGIIRFAGGAGECRLRLRGMQSDRHPDQAVYLTPPPTGKRVWERWVPAIVVEVVSRGGEDRDYVEKREEYLRAGVLEYWIFDPWQRRLVVLRRAGDVWEERMLSDQDSHETELLPGLVVSVGEILGPAGIAIAEDDEAQGEEMTPRE